VVPADSPIKSIRTFYFTPRPTRASSPTVGGTSPHLAVEEFAQRAGIQLNHIPFKGNADNMQAVLGGHTMAASDATGWAPHVEAGKLRLLATYGSKRTKRWPNVPTLDELGYQTVSDSPFGVCGKGMDPAIVRTIHDAQEDAGRPGGGHLRQVRPDGDLHEHRQLQQVRARELPVGRP
jgi:tripartite-type tricarboxylate transporter receptor subunit TctC